MTKPAELEQVASPMADEHVHSMLKEMEQLRADVARDSGTVVAKWQPNLGDESFHDAAANLAAYLALRSRDLSDLQESLAQFGLSSLGRCEGHVMATLQAVCATLARLAGQSGPDYPDETEWQACENLLTARKQNLFAAEGATVGIMVTMPSDAAQDPAMVERLVLEGMTCARINLAHDDREVWTAIVQNVRRAAGKLGRRCQILMDLEGPKCRIEQVYPEKPERLYAGDKLLLLAEGAMPHADDPPAMRISFSQVVAQLAVGTPVWLDDGKLRCEVTHRLSRGCLLDVIGVRAKGFRIRPDKGVNLPGVPLDLPPLSQDDLRHLDFVVDHADMIGYSFVQRPQDITLLDAHLAALRPDRALLPLCLKIETAEAVRNLPRLIVEAASKRPAAVMIARGDLAVNLGFARMVEIQEEILWLCEAAATPVVWATQVLDDLVKEGLATRAEATDAAMAQRAECVMLNKGPHLTEAIAFLRDVFTRMDRHQAKKIARFSPLHSWPLVSLG